MDAVQEGMPPLVALSFYPNTQKDTGSQWLGLVSLSNQFYVHSFELPHGFLSTG